MKMNKLLILVLVLSFSSFLFSEDKITNKSENEALFYIENKQYPQAIEIIQKNLANFTFKDKMLFLLGRCYENDNKLDEAISAFDQLIQEYPESNWLQKSYAKKAQILIKQKKFEQALPIFTERLSNLLDSKRRSKLSEVYIKLAEEISFQKDQKKNDYKKALVFYQRALEIGSLGEHEANTYYRVGLCYYHLKNYYKARAALEEFIKKYPDSGFMKDAHFHLGEVERQLGDTYKSRSHYFKVLEKEKDVESLDPEKILSPKTLYHIGKSYNFPYPRSEEELDLGVKYLKVLIEKYPKHKLAPQAAYEIGLGYNRFYNLKNKAVEELLKFAETYPKDQNAPLALQMVGNIHLAKKQFDKSIIYFTKLLSDYPNHRLWQTVQRQIINVKVSKGDYLYNLKKYSDAEIIYEAFLKEYPIDSRNPNILFRLGQIQYLQKNYDKAIEVWNKLFSKYPGYTIAHRALYVIAKTYVDHKLQFEKGIETFKKVRNNPWYRMAQNEISLLNKKSLNLETKKLFLSNEKPTVHVKSRNIDKLKINVYRLDLKEYFRRNQTLHKVEQLDILLIKPDETYNQKIENYRKYQEFKLDLPLKIDKSGAYIISVTSENLKASGLLLVSDLGVVVQGNRKELLIYTKNLLNEKGEGKVKVLVSNGKKIFLEGESNEEGIFKHSFTKPDKRENLDNLVVLVEKDGQYAGTGISTRGFTEYDEKEYLGYIYSDKPVYKPGDDFSYKAVLRMLHKGVLTRMKSMNYLVRFMSPSGDKIYEKEMTQSDHGSISGKIQFPRTIATGWGILRITSVKDKNIVFEKRFEIAKYTKLEKEIVFTTDKVAYFPREKVELKMVGKHLFGMPAAGKNLYYKIENESYKSSRLDNEGMFKLTIPTVKYGRRSSIRVYAYLEGGKKVFTKIIPIIVRDFSILLKSKKEIYLPSENGLIEVNTKDFFGKEIDKDLKAELYLVQDGKEEKLGEKDFKTEAGKGQVDFTFQRGGQYYVKVEGFGHNDIPVRALVYFRVLKDKEENKLFILSDSKPFQVKGQGNFTLYSQEKSGLGLLTIKGDNILTYQFIDIKAGKNEVSIPVSEKLVPNFQVNISLLKPENAYFVEKEFKVDSGVTVTINTDKTVYYPEETVTLTLETKNVKQEGLKAESSVVLVDEGVLLLTGTRLEDIKKYFYRKRRFPAHRYKGSTPYKYISKTETLLAAIVDEKEKEALRNGFGDSADSSEVLRSPVSKKQARKRKKRKAKNGGGFYADKAKMEEEVDEDSPADSIATGTTMGKDSRAKTRELLPDTAYFNPNVITDEDGKATVKIKLPKSHNRWRIIVISNTDGTQFGMSEKSISVRKDFVVHLETPITLTEGDKFSFDGELMNASKEDKKGQLEITMNDAKESKDFSVESGSHFSFESKKNIAQGKQMKVSGVTDFDGEQRQIPVEPWGTTFYKGVTGSAKDEKTEWIPLDDTTAKDKKLQLTLYPNFNQILFYLDDIMGLSSYAFLNQVASHLLVKLSLYEYLNKYEQDREGDIQKLRAEIKDKVNFLISTMDNSGAWHWIYRTGNQDYIISSFVYMALSQAKALQFKINSSHLDKSSRYLNQAFSKLSSGDLETKILVLYALSHNGKANYSYVNRIYRNRGRLSLRGLNLLALTLHNMKRQGEAGQILTLVENKIKTTGFKGLAEDFKRFRLPYLDFFSSKDEVVALSILSLIKIKKYTFKAKPYMIKLLSNLPRRGFVTHEFLALLSQCVNGYLLHQQPEQTDFNLTVKWNDQIIFQKRMTGIHPPQHITVSDNIIDKNKLELLIEGKGEVFYSGLLSYFKPGQIREKFKKHGTLTKTVKYPKYSLKNSAFTWGYSTVQVDSYSSTPQKMKEVAQHTIFPVSLRIYLNDSMPEKYLILEDTIPAGCTLLQKSTSGDFQYYKTENNKLYFYLKRRSAKHRYLYVNYSLISRFQGEYRTLPPEVYSVRDREKLISGEQTNLIISPTDYNTFTDYVFSPDELYYIGKHYFDQKDYKGCEEHLTKVFNSYQLKDRYYKEACRMLLYVSLDKQNNRDVVKYFEILKERYPELTIPFKEVIKIAESYSSIGEFERAIQVINGTMRSYFIQEVAISGTLSGMKRVKEAYQVMNQLLMDYPDYPVVLKTYYTFGQDIYLSYTEATENPKKAAKEKIDPEFYFKIAKEIFTNYLIYYPDNFNSDEVSFTKLNLYLDHKDYEDTIKNALMYTKRYPKSKFLDGYKYIAAHALFRKGDYRLAHDLSKSVAYDKFPGGADGGLRVSENKNFAILMLAKIYHHQRKFVRALEEYEKTSDHFEEAKRSIEFIKEKKIQLKEVTQIPENKESKIELKFKGVNKVSLKLFKVNFMILALKEKDLTNVTKINLSGIKPFFEKDYVLETEIPYTPMKKVIDLPIKDVGAYLLVFKTKDVQGSGIILKSNLTFDAIEKTESGRVRITVLDEEDRFVKGVNIKFIGSAKNQYKSSKTDLRGTAEVDHFPNLALVVGERKGHYCFYRGKQPIIKTRVRQRPRPRPKKPLESLYNIKKQRRSIQQKNREYWSNQNEEAEDVKGVKIQKVY